MHIAAWSNPRINLLDVIVMVTIEVSFSFVIDAPRLTGRKSSPISVYVQSGSIYHASTRLNLNTKILWDLQGSNAVILYEVCSLSGPFVRGREQTLCESSIAHQWPIQIAAAEGTNWPQRDLSLYTHTGILGSIEVSHKGLSVKQDKPIVEGGHKVSRSCTYIASVPDKASQIHQFLQLFRPKLFRQSSIRYPET